MQPSSAKKKEKKKRRKKQQNPPKTNKQNKTNNQTNTHKHQTGLCHQRMFATVFTATGKYTELDLTDTRKYTHTNTRAPMHKQRETDKTESRQREKKEML